MAIYHFSAKVISRSAGRSATGSEAYRSGTKIKDERTGQVFDYTKKQGVEDSIILAPEQTPAWVQDHEKLWNEVEKSEKRKDAQVAREVVVALPVELSKLERKELVLDFAQKAFVEKGMVASVSLHSPSKEGDKRNYHAHILLTTREISSEGFGKKNRDWNSKDLLETWRSDWEKSVNHALQKSACSERVDHRSFEKQGLEQEPTIHLGVSASNMERKAKREAQASGIPYEPVTERGRLNQERQESNKLLQSLKNMALEAKNALEKLKEGVKQKLAQKEKQSAFFEKIREGMKSRNQKLRDAEKEAQWAKRPKDWTKEHEALEKKLHFGGEKSMSGQERHDLKAQREVHTMREARKVKAQSQSRSRDRGWEMEM